MKYLIVIIAHSFHPVPEDTMNSILEATLIPTRFIARLICSLVGKSKYEM